MTGGDPGLLLGTAPVAVLAVDMNGRVLAHNHRASTWMATADESLVGRNLAEWMTPAAKLLYETHVMPRLMESGRVRELVLEIRHPSGTRHPLLLNADRRTGDDGEDVIVIAAFDASARVGFEHELVEARRSADAAHRALTLLQTATGRLAVAQGIDDLGRVLVDAAADAMQATWTSVRIAASGSGVDRWGTAPIDESAESRLGEGTATVVCRDLAEIDALVPDDSAALRRAGVESLVVTPIVRAGLDGATTLIGDIRCWFRRPRTLGSDETETLAALALQAERVFEHLRLQDRIRHSASHDSLTGLPNRAGLVEQLDRVIARVAAHASTCTVLFLDLDGFKAINDERGHATGDDVLRLVADRLIHACRPGDAVARLGGDEFVVVADGVDGANAAVFAERVRDAVRVPLDGAAAGLPLSTSIGAVTWDAASDAAVPTAAALIAAADAEMYAAKRSGKDAIRTRNGVPTP
ncbi:MAG: diguanylate cyclase [Microbacterium sp.]|nr:diguanylate cyclase [Microbacterium sp.]